MLRHAILEQNEYNVRLEGRSYQTQYYAQQYDADSQKHLILNRRPIKLSGNLSEKGYLDMTKHIILIYLRYNKLTVLVLPEFSKHRFKENPYRDHQA